MNLHHILFVSVLLAAPATAIAQIDSAQPTQTVAGSADMAQCAQAQAVVTSEIEAARARLEMARQTNSPAAMRAAVDALDGVLRAVRARLTPCTQMSASAAGPMAGHVMANSAPSPATAAAAPKQAAPPAGQSMATMPGHNMATMPAPNAQKPTAAPPRAAAPTGQKQAAPPAGQSMAHMPGHTSANMPAAAAQKPSTAPTAAEAPAGHEITTAANPAARLADLMCQPPVEPKTAPRATYKGKAYYFCSTADRDLFLKAPAEYLQR
jgi:YHS domain-containing protein